MTQLKLTVITPVYNEEAVISQFYERTRAVLDLMDDIEANILFIVDPSTDNTLEILRSIVANDPKTKVISMSSRFGHQMALLAGIEYSTQADVVVMMDSDLQHPPELIPQLIGEYRKGAAVVYTIRRHAEDVRFLRRLVGAIFYRFLRSISHVTINPNAADFRLINRQVANLLITGFKERNMFLRGLFSWMGFKQVGIEYTAERRFAGKSKYSFSRMVQLATAGILSFSVKPLHVGIFVGVGFATVSFLLIVSTLISYFMDSTIPSGWTTLVILSLLFSGVQLIVLGIMGAYLGGIYEEVKGRPRYIIDEVIMHNAKALIENVEVM
ncbi:MAG: glycosyltransferase family 2 protein [Legionella sp.]|uniref:glycosyltransferase family 2 protein n=1 Tax=Legionella sp. TaxID=459 RepID=UPI0039E71FBD